MIYTPAFSLLRCHSERFILPWPRLSVAEAANPPFFSVVSAWMIFSIDSFVHPCRQICTCNQSPVDSGLITVLIWHPAAFLVLIWTCAANLGGGSGGVAELKMSYGCCSYCVQSGGDEAEKKGFLRTQGQEDNKPKKDSISSYVVNHRRQFALMSCWQVSLSS